MDKDSISTLKKPLNLEAIEVSWTPEDSHRMRGEESNDTSIKVRSLNNNTRKLRGGDWIVSMDSHMTLGVTWKANSRQYGLTTAHSFTDQGRGVGSTVFAFNSDEEVEIPYSSRGIAHKLIRIGAVVAIDMKTDSAIIQIDPHIKIDPLVVALSAGNVCTLVLPSPGGKPLPLAYGQKLVMIGAAGRGMIGCRVETDTSEIDVKFATQSFETSINGVIQTPYGANYLTFAGDCGGIYIDKDGNAWCMHTTLHGDTQSDGSMVFTSCGVMLQDIVNAHPQKFGHLPPSLGSGSSSFREKQSSPAVIKLTTISSPTNRRYPAIYFPENDNLIGTWQKQPGRSNARLGLVFPDSDDDESVKEEEKKSGD